MPGIGILSYARVGAPVPSGPASALGTALLHAHGYMIQAQATISALDWEQGLGLGLGLGLGSGLGLGIQLVTPINLQVHGRRQHRCL